MANNPFGKMPPNIGELMKKLPKAMEDARKIEAELESLRIEAQSGAGAVKVAVTGKGDLIEIKISQDIVNPEETEILEDLVTIAVRDALTQAASARQARVGSIIPSGFGTEGLPGGFF